MPIDPEGKKSWIRVLPGLPDPSELLRKRKSHVHMDLYLGSTGVVGLDNTTFRNYLTEKESVLVMFYDPVDDKCTWSKEQFVKAAEVKLRPGQAYAAVDASKNSELCAAERVETVPFFKLYFRGRVICCIKEYQQFSANAMLKFLDNVDVIGSPRHPDDDQEKSFCGALLAIVENLPLKPHSQLSKHSA